MGRESPARRGARPFCRNRGRSGIHELLLEVVPRGVVVMGRVLVRESERLLPLGDGGVGEFRRQAVW
jgi:hypothetical protein